MLNVDPIWLILKLFLDSLFSHLEPNLLSAGFLQEIYFLNLQQLKINLDLLSKKQFFLDVKTQIRE